MKIFKLILILFLVSILSACITGSKNEEKDIYQEKLEMVIRDSKEYLRSMPKKNDTSNINSILPNGIYIFSKDINGNSILYVYTIEKLSKMTLDEERDLLFLLAIEGPKGNVFVVFEDNAKGIFYYENPEDTAENGYTPDVEIGTPIVNEDDTTVGNTDDKLIADMISEVNSNSFVVTLRKGITEIGLENTDIINLGVKILPEENKDTTLNTSNAVVTSIIDDKNIVVTLENGFSFQNGKVYVIQSNQYIYFGGLQFVYNEIVPDYLYISEVYSVTNGSFTLKMNKNIESINVKIDDFIINQIINGNVLEKVSNPKIVNKTGEYITISVDKVDESEQEKTLFYKITYDIQKLVSETITILAKINPDTTKPVISLIGSSTISVTVGETYTDLGATATDDVDGDISIAIVKTGTVNTNIAGTYIIRYNVSDSSGNAADEVIRTVTVNPAPDTTKPVISLIGSSTVSLTVGETYTDLGATATDDVDGDISIAIVKTGTVNTNIAGTYIIRYNVSDSSGNAADEVIRTVTVNPAPDTTKPVISLIGSSTVSLTVGETYTDLGATATDDVDGDISVNIVKTGTVNTDIAGTYIIRYNVSDSSGNAADEVIRTVTVNPAVTGFVYNGVSYAGQGNTLNSASPVTWSDSNINITSPTVKGFEADGYFVLEGSITYTDAYQYLQVQVIKDSTNEETSYWLRGNFSQRIWLRFGTGTYTVTVHKTQITNGNLNYEGDINGWTYWGASYTFNVTNTRNEDGKFYYPSGAIQSDDPVIMQKAQEITQGLTTDASKIKAIHDWTAKYLYYDDDSLVSGERKKQDAMSTYNNKTAVCEGYTSLMNALLRASGYKAKAISGLGGGGGHAWTNIYYNSQWYFIDVTWNDPGRYGDADGPGGYDDDPTGKNIRYDYYMLTSLTGINNDHEPQSDRVDRNGIKAYEAMPSWKGYPNGIY